MKVVKVGVIGCGFIAEEGHLPAYLGIPRVEIAAIADVNRDRLLRVSKKFNVQKCYTDYHELLESESEIDGVSICLPTFLHKDAAIASAAAHKDVLCEKPLAPTLDHAYQMIKATEKNDVRLYVGYQLRFAKVLRILKRWILSGLLGKPVQVEAVAKLMITINPDHWRHDRSKGGGALSDTGAHLADLMIWIFGDAKVSSAHFEHVHALDGDIESTVNLKFKDRLNGVLEVSWSKPSQYYIKVQGSDGILVAHPLDSTLSIRKRGRILGNFTNGFKFMVDQHLPNQWLEIWEFVDRLRDKKYGDQLATCKDGLKSLKLVTSAYTFDRK